MMNVMHSRRHVGAPAGVRVVEAFPCRLGHDPKADY